MGIVQLKKRKLKRDDKMNVKHSLNSIGLVYFFFFNLLS